MSDLPTATVSSLPIQGGGRWSARNIICIGRNYAEHAAEMGHDPARSKPFFFFKPTHALLPPGEDFVCPSFSRDVQHELELVVAIGKAGHHLNTREAEQRVSGFAVGLDMTCRDLQREAKAHGRPWTLAKSFDGSAPCSALVAGDYTALQKTRELVLKRNNTIVQRAQWREMIWSVPELIAELSRYIALQPGDLIFTGTPAGVGPVEPGDTLEASLDNTCQLRVNITRET